MDVVTPAIIPAFSLYNQKRHWTTPYADVILVLSGYVFINVDLHPMR